MESREILKRNKILLKQDIIRRDSVKIKLFLIVLMKIN
jgi:hypothetical protein